MIPSLSLRSSTRRTRRDPDTTVRVATTEVSESSPFYILKVPGDSKGDRSGGGRTPHKIGQGPGTESAERTGRNADKENRGQDRDAHKERPQLSRRLSLMKILLIGAGVGLLGGVIGTMGYSRFMGSKTAGHADQSQGEKSSGSTKSSSTPKKSSNDSGKQRRTGSLADASAYRRRGRCSYPLRPAPSRFERFACFEEALEAGEDVRPSA